MPQFSLTVQEETPLSGVYVISPLPRGFGHTVGNMLRRVLLSSLEGAAITHVKIKGVNHPFDSMSGVKEDVIALLMQLKQIRFAYEGEGEQKLTLKKKGGAKVTAADIEDSALCTVLNKDLYLCELADKGALDIELYVNRNVGYIEAEQQEDKGFDVIKMDAVFSPVIAVTVAVESTRVRRLTNNDKLTISITTDGSVLGSVALKKASELLASYFSMLSTGGVADMGDGKEESARMISKNAQDVMVDELDLPTRVINALVKNKIETVGQLKQLSDEDFDKIRGLGKKSIDELKEKLRNMTV